MSKKPDTVTASEIADYVYCPEARRLAALGNRSANPTIKQARTDHHASKATAERIAGGTIALERRLIVLALLVILAAFLWR